MNFADLEPDKDKVSMGTYRAAGKKNINSCL
jgi:hypothetical protein